jgi:hypothetical protein
MMAPGLVAGPSSGPNSPDACLVVWPFIWPHTPGTGPATWPCIGTNSPDASVPALELDLGLMGMGLGSPTAGGRR